MVASDTIIFKGKTYSLKCYSTLGEVNELASKWRDLEVRCDESFAFFQTSDWCINWLNSFAKVEEQTPSFAIKIYTLEHAGELLILLPLMEKRSKAGTLNLEFLSNPLSQYSNILHDKTLVENSLAEAFLKEITNSNSCHTLCLDYYTENSLLDDITKDTGYAVSENHLSQFLDLTQFDNWESYHSGLPKTQRKERNRRRNKLNKEGDLTYQVWTSDDEEFEAAVLKCLDHKEKWLEHVGKSNLWLSKPETKAFLSQFSLMDYGHHPSECKAVVHSLMLDGEHIAMEIGYIYKDHYYSFLGAINLDWQDFSPGKVQIEYAQKWAKEKQLSKFDFLSDPSAYKANWTNEQRVLKSRYVPLSKRGLVYSKVWKVGIRPKLNHILSKTDGNTKQFVKRIYASL